MKASSGKRCVAEEQAAAKAALAGCSRPNISDDDRREMDEASALTSTAAGLNSLVKKIGPRTKSGDRSDSLHMPWGINKPHGASLQSSCDNKHDDDNQDEAEPAAWIVTPAGTVRPRRQRADQQQDENDDQNG
jgi:hypothetical protein